MNVQDREKFFEEFNNGLHRLGRITLIAGIIVLMLLLGYGEATGVSAVVFLLLNTVLKFFANFIYIYYVFSTFIAMKEDMFAAE